MSDPPEDEIPNNINIELEAMLNRIMTNRRTRRRTLLGAVASDEVMRNIQESQHVSLPYFNIVDMSSNIVIQPIDSSTNETNISQNIDTIPNISNTLDRLLQASFYDKAKYKKVLSSKGETELEDLSYNIDLNTNTQCPILQVDFTDGMDITRLPCNHCFIPDAIKRWVKEENALCPVCRYNLDSREVEAEETQSSSPSNLLEALSRSHTPSLLNSIVQPNPPRASNAFSQSANNFLQEIIERVLVEQQEEQLQQAIINSLNNT
jgi:hypothetical protein